MITHNTLNSYGFLGQKTLVVQRQDVPIDRSGTLSRSYVWPKVCPFSIVCSCWSLFCIILYASCSFVSLFLLFLVLLQEC